MILLFFTSLLWAQQPSSPADLWIQIYEGRLTEAMKAITNMPEEFIVHCWKIYPLIIQSMVD